ncbi:hypothetical protein S7711_07535 [Stachybotrys chartarum IBT 7711]|uniref:Amino acid transporter transmembrane domain-containing protein n=1 Tax=Stachybotrys chartarum (strain CBS 109288 / IBT 7711) TaxID=1280523 RepID=A0A084AK80_STACB|nr:hypothetical protein S7711_07535 [Stachybotrys chartarum IBT 7711]KFA54158.1 hypothetical protein S40293_06308 [Stachybotrys chartarum IBT 40293]KFA72465.1 hypothetical protein S40288_08604 [Stachybotrys chartarum IBT 40288]
MEDYTDAPGSAGTGTGSDRRQAILERHLPDGYSAVPEVSLSNQPVSADSLDAAFSPFTTPNVSAVASTSASASATPPIVPPGRVGSPNPEALESSLKLQGGDIHRDLYRIKAGSNSLRRAATFSHKPSPRLHPASELPYPEQREPGGFRRQHILRKAHQRSLSTPLVVASSFVEFLDLYGSFAGENLEDTDHSEDESAIDDGVEDEESRQLLDEQRPLLGRRRTPRRALRAGDASTVKTFFTLLKAFIGTGIMFLPKAFRNGGILFSSLILIAVSLINCLCFRLLLDCRQKFGGGGYGDLGMTIVGPRFRSLILASIAISQLGFVCSGLIFTSENLWAFLNAFTAVRHSLDIGVPALIAIQLVLLIPLALIRNISKLGPAALLADAFIMIGLVYIWYYDISSLATKGISPTVRLFNPSDFALTIGSAIFTFEGIGLILPIQSSMKKPEHFGGLLYLVMFLITVIFTSIGALCYATFGEDTKIQVISNFPQDSGLVNGVQFLYSMAVLAGEPVQLFPAIRIIETSFFGERATGKKSAAIKWQKNALRTAVMGLCVGIAMLGASDLDKFVAMIGSVACVPLVYIYPAFLHYRGAAERPWVKAMDIALMVVGVIAMTYTTAVTAGQWIES